MKKLVYFLAIAGLFSFAACHPKTASTEATKADTTKVDTAKKVVDTAKAAVKDTTVKVKK